MSSGRTAGYLQLAIGIAVVAVVANVANGIELVRTFDTDTASTLNIVGSVFGQASIALAMVCAVIIGCRTIELGPWRPVRGADETLLPPDDEPA